MMRTANKRTSYGKWRLKIIKGLDAWVRNDNGKTIINGFLFDFELPENKQK